MLGGLVCLLLLSGCGSTAREGSLQRFDALSGLLRSVSTNEALVAAAVRRVNAPEAVTQTERRRGLARSLRRSALLFQRSAQAAAGRLRLIEASEPRHALRHYYSLIARTLAWDIRQGRDLRAAASIVQRDPFLLAQPDAGAIRRIERAVRLAGRRAAAAGGVAWRFRSQHPALFKYVPVRVGG
jgi:hypothetical protein